MSFKLRTFSSYQITSAVQWVKPKWRDERDEFEKYQSILSLKDWQELFDYTDALTPLSDTIWKHLENTDSYDIKDLASAKKLAGSYGKDIDRIISAFDNGSSLPAPVLVKWEDNTYSLAGGNTRLMVARALGVTPQVLILKTTP